jgi:hypothetical protein
MLPMRNDMTTQIDLNTVNNLEVEIYPGAAIPAIIKVGAIGRLYCFRAITSGGDVNITAGYVPYTIPQFMLSWKDEITALAIPITPDRLFADTVSRFDRGTFTDSKGTFEYVNGSDEGEKVCIWNSPRKV